MITIYDTVKLPAHTWAAVRIQLGAMIVPPQRPPDPEPSLTNRSTRHGNSPALAAVPPTIRVVWKFISLFDAIKKNKVIGF